MLFVCTGNQCRSPMAAALLVTAIKDRACPLTVASAGFAGDGFPPPRSVIDITADLAVDLQAHRSRRVSPTVVGDADIVVTMTRQHLVDLCVAVPAAWARCFTFAEVLRRGDAVGPRRKGDSLASWVDAVGGGRSRAGILSLDLRDDIPDPMGARRSAFARTRATLEVATSRLADLICPM